MDTITICADCKRPFSHADGQLHPTLDGIICPHCAAINLFVTPPPSWESLQEALQDELWQSPHQPEADDYELE